MQETPVPQRLLASAHAHHDSPGAGGAGLPRWQAQAYFLDAWPHDQRLGADAYHGIDGRAHLGDRVEHGLSFATYRLNLVLHLHALAGDTAPPLPRTHGKSLEPLDPPLAADDPYANRCEDHQQCFDPLLSDAGRIPPGPQFENFKQAEN